MTTLTDIAASILNDLEAAAVSITLVGADLVLKPRRLVSADLTGRLKASKDAIVRLLIRRRIQEVVAGWRDEGWREYFLERAGVIEDSNVPRDLADETAFHQTLAYVLEADGIEYRPGSITTAKLLFMGEKRQKQLQISGKTTAPMCKS